MKNNSCSIILNGHGCYSKSTKLIDISLSNFNLIFTCSMNSAICSTSHNHLLYLFINNSELAWQMLDAVKSTRIANKYADRKFVIDMDEKHTCLIYDHALTNAENVVDVDNLVDFDSNRFVTYSLEINTQIRKWNGKLIVEFDVEQVKKDVLKAHQDPNYQYNMTIVMSEQNILTLRPSASSNMQLSFKLSELLEDIIPKIKIPLSYHQNGSIDLIPCIFLDDNFQNKSELFTQ